MIGNWSGRGGAYVRNVAIRSRTLPVRIQNERDARRVARPIRHHRASAPLCRWKKMQLKIFQVIWVTDCPAVRVFLFFFPFFAHFDPSIPACRRKGSSVRFGVRGCTCTHSASFAICALCPCDLDSSGGATGSRDFAGAAEKATTRLRNLWRSRVVLAADSFPAEFDHSSCAMSRVTFDVSSFFDRKLRALKNDCPSRGLSFERC